MEGENIDSSEFMSEGLIELPQKDKPFAGSIQVCMPRGFTNLKEYVCMYVCMLQLLISTRSVFILVRPQRVV